MSEQSPKPTKNKSTTTDDSEPKSKRLIQLQQQLALTQKKYQAELKKIKDKETAKEEHQKFCLGGDVKKRAREGQSLPKVQTFQELMDYMIQDLTRPQDRRAFDLEPLPKSKSSPAKDMKKATA